MRPQRQKPYHQRKHFKKKWERAGIVAEVRKREYYEKPAQKRQRKKKEAIRREQINQLNNNTLGRPNLY